VTAGRVNKLKLDCEATTVPLILSVFGGPKVKDYWKDLGVGGRIILKWTLERTGFGWLRIGSSDGLL
jgi:hypothetical protein